MTGTIFDIKEFSIQDGPGARTTVFMKGCPLSCKWCHNPEGLSPFPELMVKTARCRHCGRCFEKCGHPECAPFGRCVHACPDRLISICGREWDAEALAEKLAKQADFFAVSGGGVTVSGGEPTLQAEFVAELLWRLGKKHIHRAVETCGFAAPERFMMVVENADYVMMDIKLADPEAHREWCGVDNAPIFENFDRLKKSGVQYLIRVPLIPGVTDTRENLTAVSKIVGDSSVELLGYNSFAGAKYPDVGKAYALSGKEKEETAPDISIFANAVYSR